MVARRAIGPCPWLAPRGMAFCHSIARMGTRETLMPAAITYCTSPCGMWARWTNSTADCKPRCTWMVAKGPAARSMRALSARSIMPYPCGALCEPELVRAHAADESPGDPINPMSAPTSSLSKLALLERADSLSKTGSDHLRPRDEALAGPACWVLVAFRGG